MLPYTINEVVEGLQTATLTEGQHAEFKIYLDTVKVDDLARSMISLANSGGGVVVIGIADMSFPRSTMKGVTRIDGMPDGTRDSLGKELPDFISARVKNLDNWWVEYGEYMEMDIATVFVKPSIHGMSYVYSASDKANRSFYYRKGKDIINVRRQFRTVYKYMTMDVLISCLENKSWRFWEPRKWADKYESRFYCADYSLLNAEPDSVQRVYATCVTRNKNNEAAWKVYAGKEGMQAHCVQLELDLSALLDELFKSRCKIFERKVQYLDEYKILHLHETTNASYEEFFQDFDFGCFLNLMALKRDAYTYENEVRFFATEQVTEDRSYGKMKPFYKDLTIDWGKVIKSMRIDKNCSDSELIALRYSCWSRGINPVIKGKKLPGSIPATAPSMNQVDVKLFNIDDMPGRKSIVIER